jgi:hypothetical protein
MKKHILFLILFSLSACVHPLLGKQLPPRNYPSIDAATYINIQKPDNLYEYGKLKYTVSPGDVLEVMRSKTCRSGYGECWQLRNVKTGEIGYANADRMKEAHQIQSGLQMQSGHHRLDFKNSIIDYDWIIDSEKQTITFKGFLKITGDSEFKRIIESSDYKEGSIRFEILFLDSEYRVIHVGRILKSITHIKPGVDTTFNKTFKYSRDYKFVIFKWGGEVKYLI